MTFEVIFERRTSSSTDPDDAPSQLQLELTALIETQEHLHRLSDDHLHESENLMRGLTGFIISYLCTLS